MRPEPRGSGNVSVFGVVCLVCIASMRPEPRGSGNPTIYRVLRIQSLRFNEAGAAWLRKFDSHAVLADFAIASFNEAGAAWLRKCDLPIRSGCGGRASMRPEPRGSGNTRDGPGVVEICDASMRPEPRGSGNVSGRVDSVDSYEASMRPEPRGSGNRSATCRAMSC